MSAVSRNSVTVTELTCYQECCSKEECCASLQRVVESISACMWRAFCCKKKAQDLDVVVLHPINGSGTDESRK